MAVEAPDQTPPPPSSSQPVASTARARTRFGRVTIGFNVVLQVLLLTGILLMINGFAFKHFKRFDLSRDRKYALTSRTKQFLASLGKPARITLFMSPTDTITAQVQTDAETLAQEYRNAQPRYVSLESVNPYRDVGRAAEIQTKYKLNQQENVIIVSCEDRSKVIKAEDMVELDHSGDVYGQQPTVTAFKGEQAFTNALLEVTEGKKSSVYYVRGHGEPDMGGREGAPLANLGTLLEGEHLNLSDINLLNVESIPADATLVMVLAPRYDLTEREIKLLDDYWNRGGRIMLAVNPDVATPNIDAMLDKLGVHPEDDRVLQTVSIGGGVKGIVRDVYAQVAGGTPIAKELAAVNLIFLGATRSLTLNPASVSAAGIKTEPLAIAIKGFWGETEYKDMEATGVYFDQGKDKEAPLAVAATIEKGAVGDQRVQVGSSRMITFGNGRFLESDAMTQANASFFLSSFDWLLSREQLIGIAPRQIQNITLDLQEDQLRKLMWITTLGMPALFALIGVIVWWRRRA